MAWGLSSWLVLVRLLQVLGSLTSAGLNSFLVVYIYIHHLGYSGTLSALECMISVIVVYTGIVLLVGHTFRRLRHRAPVIVVFIVGDVIMTGLIVGIISLLARAGVPANCGGLTRTDFSGDDAPNKPPPGYTTIRFSDEEGIDKGVLDKYCALERGVYFIFVAIIFSYMITVTLSVLHVLERYYIRKSQADMLFGSNSHRLEQDAFKPNRSFHVDVENIAGPSHGVTSPVSASSLFEDRVLQRQTLPVSPVTPVTPSTSFNPPRNEARGAAIQPVEEDPAEAAMVTDGYRQRPETGMPPLPPYTPGSSSGHMIGHGGENNDLRLSEYVKGETQAQTMKDSGR